MGMSIDEHLLYEMGYNKGFGDGIKGSIPKADYEARLKADMAAMLEDLDLQIDESGSYNREVAKVQRLIRDKINKLRGEEDGTNEKTSD